VLEELRMAHPTITSSRAQAARKLDCIAEKKRYPGGVFWEVRREALEELGLEELMVSERILLCS
jgi:chromatin assembly factor 1 subunit A